MTTTTHFAHVSPELQSVYLGIYLGHADFASARYELWQGGPLGGLQWWGPASEGEPASRLELADGCEDSAEAVLALSIRLRRLTSTTPDPRQVSWCPAA